MHASSLENMEKCFERYGRGLLTERAEIRVLDIGAADVNGSYREIFTQPGISYLGADMVEGQGVDLVLADPYRIPFPAGSVDLVVSGQMLEHCEFFWLSFAEMIRILRPDGYLFLIAPSGGPEHRYPVDCYRFYPDAFRALAKHAGCHVVDLWRDERGPWFDLVGVFSKFAPWTPAPTPATAGANLAAERVPRHADPEFEVTRGSVPYVEVLTTCHAMLSPRLYVEIGVQRGQSLALATGPAVGIDPTPIVDRPLPESAQIEAMTSDAFFETRSSAALSAPIDFAFIDGMHKFEFALRDFMNIERRAHPATLVAIDDVFPNHPAQSTRNRTTAHWSGDVWKLADLLSRFRPDLVLLPLDASPAGLLLVAGLDPDNRILWQSYNQYCAHYTRDNLVPPPAVLLRRTARDPADDAIAKGLASLRDLRDQEAPVTVVQRVMAETWSRRA